MPRPPRTPRATLVAAATPANSMIAAGARQLSGRQTPATRQTWQDRAWYFYDTIGELRFAATWFGRACSRATLHAAVRAGSNFSKQDTGSVATVVEEFFGGPEGQAQMISATAVHLFMVGECYLVKRKPRKERSEEGEIWEVVAATRVSHVGKDWTIRYSDNSLPVQLSGDEDIIRVWYPHPADPLMADSPVRAVLATLAEIERITWHIQAQLMSRLAGSGLLLLPQGMTFPSPPPDSGLPDDASEADKAMATLFEAMTQSIANPGSAEAVPPIVFMVPNEFVDKANLLKFWSELDQHAIEIRTEAIRRLALGLDMPVEVLLGTSDLNHWSAWQVDEASVKSHIEPVLELIVDAITVNYVIPESGDPNAAMRYDTANLRLRPNRSKEAIELWDRGELKSETLIRETGFGPDDIPDEEEKREWLLTKVAANSSATPEMMSAALLALGVDVGSGVPETIRITDNQTPKDPAKESRPDPSLRDHPTQDIPQPQDIPTAASAGLMATAEALTLRALERAGNRLRTMRGQRPSCSADEVYLFVPARPTEVEGLLAGAWDLMPKYLKGVPFEQQQIVQAGLEQYVTSLLLGQKEHSRDLMQRHLAGATVRELH